MIALVREYSLRSAPLFLWDVDEDYTHTSGSLLHDIPASVGAAARDSFRMTQADRREKLLFHVQSGDYFGMLATALGFVEEKLNQSVCTNEEKKVILSDELLLVRNLRDDLRYLHDNFDIYPKKSWSDPA